MKLAKIRKTFTDKNVLIGKARKSLSDMPLTINGLETIVTPCFKNTSTALFARKY